MKFFTDMVIISGLKQNVQFHIIAVRKSEIDVVLLDASNHKFTIPLNQTKHYRFVGYIADIMAKKANLTKQSIYNQYEQYGFDSAVGLYKQMYEETDHQSAVYGTGQLINRFNAIN